MSEPIDTSREAFGRLVMSTATNGERALVQSLTDLVRAILDERDALAVRVEDAESQVEHFREVSTNCGRQLGEAYEAHRAAEKERDRLFEERLAVMGMLHQMDPMLPVSIVDAVRQLISACECNADAYGHADMRAQAAEQERDALALSNHFYEGTTTAQRERAEATEKLLVEAVELLRSDVPKFLQPIADFFARYNASRPTVADDPVWGVCEACGEPKDRDDRCYRFHEGCQPASTEKEER